MEIAELKIIGDFEAGIKCLQNPSLLSRLSLIDKLPRPYSFWTWGALMIAVFATFTNVFNTIKLFLHQIHLKLLASCRKSCHQKIFNDDDFDFDFSDDDVEDETPSSISGSDDEELDPEDDRVDEIFRAEGSTYWDSSSGPAGDFTLRRRNGFSWSDFSAGKSVVQLWDSFGLGLDFEDEESDYGNEISIWDLDRDVKISSGRGWRVASPAENVVLTAEMSGSNGGVGFGTFDAKVNETSPAIYAAWRQCHRKKWFDDDVIGRKEE